MKTVVSGDQGPTKGVLGRLPDRRAMMLDMGKPVSFLLLTPAECDAMAAGIRAQVARWWGEVRYNPAELARYVRCNPVAGKGLVRLEFLPASAVPLQGALAANPEVFMALADVIEAARKRLPRLHGAPA